MTREQIKQVRVRLLSTWMAVLSLWLLLGGCTAGAWSDEGVEPPEPETKYPISFAPLTVAGEVETRATATSMASGTVRLLVYTQGASLTNPPLANRTYTVKDGSLTEADGEDPLQLEVGAYQFYTLSPSSLNPSAGKVTVAQQTDVLASLTAVTVSPVGTAVSIAALSHKGAQVSFTVVKATGATFFSLTQGASLQLYNQPGEATFQLGAGGGSLASGTGAGTLTLAGSGGTYSSPVHLKEAGEVKVTLDVQVIWASGEKPVSYTLRAQVPATSFEPGKSYTYRIEVTDPRGLVEVKPLGVTAWTVYTWEDLPY